MFNEPQGEGGGACECLLIKPQGGRCNIFIQGSKENVPNPFLSETFKCSKMSNLQDFQHIYNFKSKPKS
jgi:hypothetical protein